MTRTYIWFIIGLLVLSGNALALTINPGYGQKYTSEAYYSVIFDDRGLASVTLGLDYVNNGYENPDSVILNIPGKEITLVSAFVKEDCGLNFPPQQNITAYQNCYYSNTFKPANFEKISQNTFKIKLNKPMKKGEQASFLVSYRAFGYVKDELIRKNFDFETIKYGFAMDSTRVSINVDEGLLLKEGESKGDYNYGATNAIYAKGGVQATSEAMSAYSYAKSASGFTKQKSVLLSGETFHVTGSYGKNGILLSLPEIVAGVAIAIMLYFAYHRFIKKPIVTGTIKEDKGKESLEKTVLFPLIASIAFALGLNLLVVLPALFMRYNDPRALFLYITALWVASVGYIYSRDRKLQTTLIFVGFSILFSIALMVVVFLFYSIFGSYGYYPSPY